MADNDNNNKSGNSHITAINALTQQDHVTPSVIIVGAGIAGLFTALKLAPIPVTVVSAAKLGEQTSSGWAQGGIAAALDAEDTVEAHVVDTIRAGAGLVDANIAQLIASEAKARITDLIDFGVPFDADAENNLRLSREAAHSARRVVRVTGDRAGHAIMKTLIAKARQTPSITFLEEYKLRELVTGRGRVVGLIVDPVKASSAPDGPNGKGRKGYPSAVPRFLPARAVVLATGGIGGLYDVTTNPAGCNGEVLAIAARAGAIIADPEFVQFHPTAIAVGTDPAPLATEALRGEGAVLVNSRGERFMVRQHPDAELAPRDIVARAVHREIMTGRGAFLDCRAAIGRDFPTRFPTVYAKAMAAGIDPVRDLIPVAPAAHYHMGGIHTDANGRTTIDRLWACGEVASTGAHGANRLASNSLLEAVVFAARVASDIANLPYPRTDRCYQRYIRHYAKVSGQQPPQLPAKLAPVVRQLREVMTAHVGVVRQEEGLAHALRQFEDIGRSYAQFPQLKNMAEAAKFVTVAALMRTESRGGHFRADFPKSSPAWAKRSFLTQEAISQRRILALLNHSQSEPALTLAVGE